MCSLRLSIQDYQLLPEELPLLHLLLPVSHLHFHTLQLLLLMHLVMLPKNFLCILLQLTHQYFQCILREPAYLLQQPTHQLHPEELLLLHLLRPVLHLHFHTLQLLLRVFLLKVPKMNLYRDLPLIRLLYRLLPEELFYLPHILMRLLHSEEFLLLHLLRPVSHLRHNIQLLLLLFCSVNMSRMLLYKILHPP